MHCVTHKLPLTLYNHLIPTMGRSRSDGSNKERLRWTQELHDRFEEAVNQLGGPDSMFLDQSVYMHCTNDI